jgi:RNA polymerase sigma-70 factor, ECF subfamily
VVALGIVSPTDRVAASKSVAVCNLSASRYSVLRCTYMTLEKCQELPDDDLVRRVRAGETHLYELLMRRYNQRVFRVIRSVASNDADAEDILQEAWVRAFEHLDQFEGRASFSTWVTKIGFYESLARARKSARLTALDESHGENMDNPERQAMRDELGRMLQSAVDLLPASYRSVFVMREVERMSTAETAECLEISEEAVKTRLHRSRAMLRRDLERRLGPALAAAYAFLGHRCDRVVAAVMRRVAPPNSSART